MLRSAQNCKKCTFLDNLRTKTQEGNMGTWQMTPFFLSTFSDLFVIFIPKFENTQNSFLCDPPFAPFWSVNTSIFSHKLPIQTAHHTFLESRHPEVTKNLYYVLSTRRSQIPIFLGSSSWTIDPLPPLKIRFRRVADKIGTITIISSREQKGCTIDRTGVKNLENGIILFSCNTK